jgi:pimeloyl-ACP methyl ester carboxylesterase
MSKIPIGRNEVATALRYVAGAAELASRLGSEITSLVQEVHAASSPLPVLSASAPIRGIYGSIRFGFTAAGRLAALGGQLIPREPADDTWLDVQSAVNGAFGHFFDDADNAFAVPMSLQRADDERLGQRLVVFVHGLCTNERCWRNPEHARFVAWARDALGAGSAYVRYNTGRRISANGGLLAELLEREARAREIVVIGHSMGGLVALSALHQAAQRGFDWPQRVSRLACLGSPHEGASLERIGNHANRLLRVLPWSRPFMRLGNLRSDGIRDLRFGHLVEEDWRSRRPDETQRSHSAVRLADHVDHLFVAAARSAQGVTDSIGDWLVSVESAHARNLHRETAVRRVLLRDLDHIGLLDDARVYAALRSWLDAAARSWHR